MNGINYSSLIKEEAVDEIRVPELCWSLTIRLFSVIIKTLIGGGSNSSAEKRSVYSAVPVIFTRS